MTLKNKKIKKIDLVFENCDGVTLVPNMFKYLDVRGITKRYMINCFQYENGEVNEYIECRYFYIEINKLGLNRLTEFEDTLSKKLLEHKDITHVHIFFSKGKDKYIGVPWKGDNWTNELQEYQKFGDDLYITIKKL